MRGLVSTSEKFLKVLPSVLAENFPHDNINKLLQDMHLRHLESYTSPDCQQMSPGLGLSMPAPLVEPQPSWKTILVHVPEP